MTALAAIALLAAAPRMPIANALANPSFEVPADSPDWRWQAHSTTNLTLVGDPSDPDTPEYTVYEMPNNPGPTSQSAHSGNYAFDFRVGYNPAGNNYHAYSTGSHATLRQTLTSMVAGSTVAEASVWVKAPGETIRVQISYGDPFALPFDRRPPSVATHVFPSGRGTWVKWDFTSAIDPTRKVSSIVFSIDTFPKGQTVLLDDVALLVDLRP